MTDTEATAVQVNGDGREGGWAAILDRLHAISEKLGVAQPDSEPGWLAGFRADAARLEALAVTQVEFEKLRRECDCYLEAVYSYMDREMAKAGPIHWPTPDELAQFGKRITLTR